MAGKYKPVRLLPFDLKNISDFVVDQHPLLFPDTLEYRQYWDQQAEYVVEGKWGLDNDEKNEGGWRWIPGNLYFYVNMSVIKDEDDDGTEVTVRPKLRDVEWYIFYALAACDGFSGFSDDDIYTCSRIVESIENNQQLLEKDKIRLKKIGHHVYNSKGELKKYKEAREYLYEYRDKPMGKALYDNEALNMILLSSRGIGKSHSMGGGVIGYDFATNGARTVSQFLNNETSSTIVVGSEDSKKSTELLNKFSDTYEYLRTDVGAYFRDGISRNGCFWRTYEGSLSSGTNKPFTNRVSLKGGKGEEGPGSKIVHVSYKANPQAGVGYRARRMIVEEAGLLVSFFETHAENSATQKRKTKFGYTVYIGTGGSIKKIKEIREAFYNPRDYQVLPFKDIFNGTEKELGLFVPSYYRNDIYRNELGNTNYVAAFNDEMIIREDMKKGGSAAYEGYIISYPIVPQEMFLNNAGNIYPTDALEERLHELESGAWKPNFGELLYTDSTKTRCYWAEDLEKRLPYIKRWGDEKKMRDLKTGFVMYEPPSKNMPQPSYTRPMYLVLYDLIHKEGENVGSSLAVAFVFKFWDLLNPDKIQFNIVAEWIGRFPNMEDNHEQALKLATFYNAKVLPEFNGDFVRYCRTSNRLHMLQPRPGLAIDGILKQKNANDFGVYISPGMIPDMELYSLEVLDKPVNKTETLEGNLYVERYIRMVHKLTSMRLTEELLYYDRDGNFDFVSAFLLLGLVIRELDIKPTQRHDENKVKTKAESVKKYLRAKEYLDELSGNNAYNY
jgi:hypothetical protein